MAAHYTVVQYLPDPLTGERSNIGVIAFNGLHVRCRFLRDWHRVRQFGGTDVGFLLDFADRLKDSEGQLALTGMDLRTQPFQLDEDAIRRMAGSWSNSIQFSEPKASL